MITTTMIIEELIVRGYEVKEEKVIKNGTELEGILFISDDNLCPIIYVDSIIKQSEIEEKSVNDIVEEIIDIFENNKNFKIDINKFFEAKFILSHIYIGLQKDSVEEILKRNTSFEGIESYLYIRENSKNGMYSVKVSMQMLNISGITEDEAWKSAVENTNAESVIKSVAEVLAEMVGIAYVEDEDAFPLYTVTNRCGEKGASAILNKKVLTAFGEKYQTDKIVVLPSSIHEMLIAPYTGEMDLDDFSNMVKEVNNSKVAPQERLTDRAYIVSV